MSTIFFILQLLILQLLVYKYYLKYKNLKVAK